MPVMFPIGGGFLSGEDDNRIPKRDHKKQKALFTAGPFIVLSIVVSPRRHFLFQRAVPGRTASDNIGSVSVWSQENFAGET